jgi:hypothetical protein
VKVQLVAKQAIYWFLSCEHLQQQDAEAVHIPVCALDAMLCKYKHLFMSLCLLAKRHTRVNLNFLNSSSDGNLRDDNIVISKEF